ncbi:LytTR family DNA-binding domain-containing protein [Lentimicrobium sp.]|uniref:LytR/AlgR family response regulator transcription factor n=1 Tax=Lentimicrobium sp. TaxID=2034841 RepID=UPI002B9188B7|nr:LytTR family DNA-binding domain-containing protein [Lentimicrobium sp.]HPJ62342.1 LytTR family DNA-binding domain-containing protein [Lentimicrobium sp.]
MENINEKLSCLVVDDEQPAQWVLTSYISETSNLELKACAFDAMEALEVMKNHSIDLLFLDINLPGLNGLEMLDTLEFQPMVIFTTAYAAYAAESFEYNVVDYLVKPVTKHHFERAVARAFEKARLREVTANTDTRYPTTSLELNLGGSTETVETENIVYLQSYGNYVKVFLENRMILATSTTHQLLSQLPQKSFLRIHKSFIVNRKYIKAYSNNSVVAGKEKLPIGISYRQSVVTALNQ